MDKDRLAATRSGARIRSTKTRSAARRG